MKIQSFTDKGMVRDMNQDAFKTGEFQNGGAWAVVCDGMGGVAGGQVASEICVNEVSSHIEKGYRKGMSMKSVKNLLVSAITAANIKVYETAEENLQYSGMGTTVVAVVILNGFAAIAHIGDSRAYFINEEEIKQVTKDHSVVQFLIDTGRITVEQSRTHPDRNVITRAVGVSPEIEVDVDIIPVNKGDIVLVCTDGLYEYITQEEMFNVIKNTQNSEPAKVLLDMANEAGGKDNITVVTVEG